MHNPFESETELDPELERSAVLLDKFTRKQLHQFSQSRDDLKRDVLMDGRYSFERLLDAQRTDSVAKTAPYEHEVSKQIERRVGRPPHNGYEYVPVPLQRRDFTVALQGANITPTTSNPGGLFVYFLDQFFPYNKLGITRVSVPSLANVPGCSGNVSTNWLMNEGSTIAESQFDVIVKASTPKTVGAYVELSHKFIKQSPFGETVILQALARGVAAELQRKMLTGSGTNGEFLGLFNQVGITNLGAASANYTTVLNCLGTLDTANALLTPTSAGFVAGASVTKLFRSREKVSGSGMIQLRDDLAGYPSITTNATSPNTLTYGDWSQLCLLEYGVLEIGSDPYGANSSLFTKGIVGIRCLWTCDIVLLNPSSFVCTGALS